MQDRVINYIAEWNLREFITPDEFCGESKTIVDESVFEKYCPNDDEEYQALLDNVNFYDEEYEDLENEDEDNFFECNEEE